MNNNMEDQFCTYDICLKLKELGFNEPCLGYYTKNNDINFILLSAKTSGELVGQGHVKNELFDYLKNNDKTSGELYTLSNSISAPLWGQAIDWIFEKFSVIIDIHPIIVNSKKYFSFEIFDTKTEKIMFDETDYGYNTIKEARTIAILKSFKLCGNE